MLMTSRKVVVQLPFSVLTGLSNEIKEIHQNIVSIYMENKDNPIISDYYKNFETYYKNIQVGCQIPEKYYLNFHKQKDTAKNKCSNIQSYLFDKKYDIKKNVPNFGDLVDKYSKFMSKDQIQMESLVSGMQKPMCEGLRSLFTEMFFTYKEMSTKVAEEDYNDHTDAFLLELMQDDLATRGFSEDEIYSILIPMNTKDRECLKYVPNDEVLVIKFCSYALSINKYRTFEDLANLFSHNDYNIDNGTTQIMVDYIQSNYS